MVEATVKCEVPLHPVAAASHPCPIGAGISDTIPNANEAVGHGEGQQGG